MNRLQCRKRGKNLVTIIEYVLDFLKSIFDYLNDKGDMFSGWVVALILLPIVSVICWEYKKIKTVPKDINKLINGIDKQSNNWKRELTDALKIKETMKSNFPGYKNFILIQYGSSVKSDNKLPSDYDFIVLMLGYPEEDVRYMHNKGTTSDIAGSENITHVDLVFRDYLSFLFAASAGMPYENSVINNGKIIYGYEGYFQWLNNITKNILFDRDFLIRRFKDKIIIEKEEYIKCKNENEKYHHDMYYVIRSGYYYITSLLQLKEIESFDKVIIQKDVVKLANVRYFYNSFENEYVK